MSDLIKILPGLAKVLVRGSSHISLDAFKAATAVSGHFVDAYESYGPTPSSPPSSSASSSSSSSSSAFIDSTRKSLQSTINPTPTFTSSDVPQSRLQRASTYTSLALSMLTSSNRGDTLTAYLCRLRGGALKLGQMLSIQEDSLLPTEWVQALERVRKAADVMPEAEVDRVLEEAYGSKYAADLASGEGILGTLVPPPSSASSTSSTSSTSTPSSTPSTPYSSTPSTPYSSSLSPSSFLPSLPLTSLSSSPLASASIGQVHKGALSDGTWVVAKLQYPGIQQAIDSDLANLQMIISYTNLIPKGVFINDIIKEGRKELSNECNYINELTSQSMFHSFVNSDPQLVSLGFQVPRVAPSLSTENVLVTEFAFGYSIDKCVDLPQEDRDRIARGVLRLTLLELFVWRFMQTDPNWGNFIFDPTTQTVSLIDFGGARSFDKDFVDGYREIVWAAANQDEEGIMSRSIDMKFLTGKENQIMLDAHLQAGLILGEPFRSSTPYDFAASRITSRIADQAKVFTEHRLQAPPTEVYTLHRKLAGAFLLAIKLKAKVNCRDIMEEVYTASKKS